jgi:hypothetical protein
MGTAKRLIERVRVVRIPFLFASFSPQPLAMVSRGRPSPDYSMTNSSANVWTARNFEKCQRISKNIHLYSGD